MEKSDGVGERDLSRDAKFSQRRNVRLKEPVAQSRSISVPSNIAEGQARYSRREFRHFLNNARGSLAEVKTQIVLARDLAHLGQRETDFLLDKAAELGRILNGLTAATKEAACRN